MSSIDFSVRLLVAVALALAFAAAAQQSGQSIEWKTFYCIQHAGANQPPSRPASKQQTAKLQQRMRMMNKTLCFDWLIAIWSGDRKTIDSMAPHVFTPKTAPTKQQ